MKPLLFYSRMIPLSLRRTITVALLTSDKAIMNRALEDYTKALELSPDDAEIYFDRGIALFP